MPTYTSIAVPVIDTVNDQTLPGLRGLKRLQDLRPVIVYDTREVIPLVFTRLKAVPGTLVSGDYSAAGVEHLVALERKSLDDLANCCMSTNRQRFERELIRLRGYTLRRLIIIGTRKDIEAGLYHSKIAPKAVLASLGAFEARYSVPVEFCATPQAAAHRIEELVWYFAREIVEMANDLLRGCEAGEDSSAPDIC